MFLLRFLKGAWNGEERLWKVFWLGGIAFYAFSIAVQVYFSSLESLAFFILLIGTTLFLIVRIAFLYCVWRCSNNSQSFWGKVSRAWVWVALLGDARLLLRGENYFDSFLVPFF